MRPLLVFPLAAFALACSSSSENLGAPSGPGKDGGREAAVTPPRDSGKGQTPEAAPPPDSGGAASCPDAGAPGSVCITEVRGRAIDGSGAPIAKGQLVTACGAVQCNPGFTDDTGRFTIPVGLRLVPGDYSVQVHKRVDFTAFYFRLPPSATGPIIDVGDARSLAMPATGPELAVDRAGVPAQSVTSGDVTLDVPGGIYVRLDIESNLADTEHPGKGRAFRALKIPNANLKEFVDSSLGVSALYALEPFECTFEAAGVPDKPVDVRLSFANSENIAAGTAIDLLALGTYIYADWIPPAQFTKVAQGHVSADGTRIELDAGEGLPYLTWVALKPAP
jgi:hypothetical protein